MVAIASVEPADRKAVEHVVRDHRGRAQAREHPASDVVSETDFHAGFGAKVTQRLRLKPVQ
jgi:hypothetical protein